MKENRKLVDEISFRDVVEDECEKDRYRKIEIKDAGQGMTVYSLYVEPEKILEVGCHSPDDETGSR